MKDPLRTHVPSPPARRRSPEAAAELKSVEFFVVPQLVKELILKLHKVTSYKLRIFTWVLHLLGPGVGAGRYPLSSASQLFRTVKAPARGRCKGRWRPGARPTPIYVIGEGKGLITISINQ